MVHSQLMKMKKRLQIFAAQKVFFLTKYSFFLINGCSSWLIKSGIHQKCQLPSLSIISIFNFAAMLIHSQKHQLHHHIHPLLIHSQKNKPYHHIPPSY